MLLKEDSILKYLPANIEPKQLMIFDSLRFVLETIDWHFESLNLETQNISTVKDRYSKIPLFSHCWNFINSIAIFRKLYQKLPSESNYEIIKELFKVVAPRNTFQHIDVRIDEFLFENKEAFFGSIQWVFKNEETKQVENLIAISGLHYPGYFSPKTFTVSKYQEDMPIISEIILSTVSYHKNGSKENIDININSLYSNLKEIIDSLEKHLVNFVENNKLKQNDWKDVRDITLRMKQEKK